VRGLVDGEPAVCVSVDDRGLTYGDGVFRTLRVRDGRPTWWRDHYAKLAADCRALAIPCPDEAGLRSALARLAAGLATGVAKIIVTRGRGQRGYAIPEPVRATRIVTVSPLPAHGGGAARVRWCELRLARQPRLAGIKHLNRLENVLARSEWNDPAVAEGLLCDDTGAVIGGTMSNLFLVCAGRLVTPALTAAGVDGVARQRVLAAARRHGIAVEVRRVEADAVTAADELFLTNSIVGVWPVAALGDREWPRGPLSESFGRWIDETD
jgi:4-amino-4-deoxychorismate lyase